MHFNIYRRSIHNARAAASAQQNEPLLSNYDSVDPEQDQQTPAAELAYVPPEPEPAPCMDEEVAAPDETVLTDTPDTEIEPSDGADVAQYKAYKRLSVPPPQHLGDRNPFDLYPDMCLTSLRMKAGVYKVLRSNPPLNDPQLQPIYTLLSHGFLTHEYSLLPDPPSGVHVRPIALYDSPFKRLGRPAICDLSNIQGDNVPMIYSIALFSDSYTKGHIEFCVCNDYRYEWRYEEVPAGSGYHEYMLWRRRLEDDNVVPVARISESIFRSPIDDSKLWTVELDSTKVSPIAAYLSAFTLESIRCVPLPMYPTRVPAPPRPLLNAVFQDQGAVIDPPPNTTRDWVDELHFQRRKTLHVIGVYNFFYVLQFNLPPQIIEFLNKQATETTIAIRSRYGLS